MMSKALVLFLSLPFCSQSLINLLVMGHAVSNVWDGDRECSGMSKNDLFLEILFSTFSLGGGIVLQLL